MPIDSGIHDTRSHQQWSVAQCSHQLSEANHNQSPVVLAVARTSPPASAARPRRLAIEVPPTHSRLGPTLGSAAYLCQARHAGSTALSTARDVRARRDAADVGGGPTKLGARRVRARIGAARHSARGRNRDRARATRACRNGAHTMRPRVGEPRFGTRHRATAECSVRWRSAGRPDVHFSQ